MSNLTEHENWLYEDGYDQPKEIYIGKMRDIYDFYGRGLWRQKEKEMRDEYHPVIKWGLFNFTETLVQVRKDMEWIEETVFKEMEESISNMTTFIHDVEEKLSAAPFHEDPPVWYEDVYKRFEWVLKKMERLVKTKKPRPKTPETGSPEFFEEMFKKYDESDLEIEGMTKEQIKEYSKKVSPLDLRKLQKEFPDLSPKELKSKAIQMKFEEEKKKEEVREDL